MIAYLSSKNNTYSQFLSTTLMIIPFYFFLYPFLWVAFQKQSFCSVSHFSNCLIFCYASLSAQFSQGIQCMGDGRQNGLETALIEVGTSFIDDFGLRISSKQGCLLIHSSEKRSELTFIVRVHCHQCTLCAQPHPHAHVRVLLLPPGLSLSCSLSPFLSPPPLLSPFWTLYF